MVVSEILSPSLAVPGDTPGIGPWAPARGPEAMQRTARDKGISEFNSFSFHEYVWLWWTRTFGLEYRLVYLRPRCGAQH